MSIKMSKSARKIFNLSPAEFDKFASNKRIKFREGLQETVRELEGLAFAFATRAAYFSERHGSGCGDQGHKAAVKAYNRVNKRVRSVLGFCVTHELRF